MNHPSLGAEPLLKPPRSRRFPVSEILNAPAVPQKWVPHFCEGHASACRNGTPYARALAPEVPYLWP
jgi:hypothetical protein